MKKPEAKAQIVHDMLNQHNRVSVRVGSLEQGTFKNLDQLILYTLQFYNLEVWTDYFSLLTRGLMYLAIRSCNIDQCSIKLIKEERSFVIQIHSDLLGKVINKREFIEFVNDLSENVPDSAYYSDLFFLKKLFEIKQIDSDNITYSTNRIELTIPDSNLTEQKWLEIRDSVVSSIESLPPLKENLIVLESMIHGGHFDMNSIADQVGTDPGLTMDILKIVNSGAYVLNTRIEDIHSALKFLGLRELYNLLLTLSIRSVLSVEDRELKKFWHHSYKSAFYACRIAEELRIKVAHTDSIYTAALLHDVGKFPILAIFDDANDVLFDYCSRFRIFLSDIEDALTGIRHSETGFLMAEKWNLPDSLKLVMRFHHEPENAPEKIRNLNDIVYLADCLVYSETGRFNLEDLNRDVLKRHKISSPDDLRERFSGLNDQFNSADLWK